MVIEQGIRGRYDTYCKKIFTEANNKYMKDYNPEKDSKFIQYLDARVRFPNSASYVG